MDPKTASTVPRSAARRSLGKLLLAGSVALATVLLLEASLRVWTIARGGSVEELFGSIRRIAEEVDQPAEAYADFDGAAEVQTRNPGMISHPYFGWYGRAKEAHIPELVRLEREQPENVYQIIIIGGSVAASVLRTELRGAISRDPRFEGRDVRVRLEAVAGFKQPQPLNLVAYLLAAGLRPHAVINVDGFAELALSNQNVQEFQVHPNQPFFSLWGPIATADSIDRVGLDLLLNVRAEQVRARELAGLSERGWRRLSALHARLTLGRMTEIRRRFHQASDRYLQWASVQHAASRSTGGPPFEEELDAVVDVAVRNWSECSRSLQGLCDARSIYYLHVLHPTLHDAGSKTLTREELATVAPSTSWIEAVRVGYPRLREEGRRLRESGVHFFDASMIFAGVTDPLYRDTCHFVDSGRRLLALAIAEAFLANLPEGEPPPR